MTSERVAHVLVVDDEPELRELLVDVLTSRGVRVQAAASGKEAMRLAGERSFDLVVTDLCLGDCNGMEVIERVRRTRADVPAVVITGRGDARSLSEASRLRPIELMTKPLNVERLQATVLKELGRKDTTGRLNRRVIRLRKLARQANLQRRIATQRLNSTCSDLTAAYRKLSGQLSLHEAIIGYQRELIAAKTDDDVFRELFRVFVRRTGGVYGVAMVCDSNAELQMVGRFGVPSPDNQAFCRGIAKNIVDRVLGNPRCMIVDATDEAHEFDESIRRYLCGVSILAIPLIPSDGQMIGVVILYRKGEQPFHDSDLSLAEMIARTTAISVQSNE
jgi:DNA-binding response OmpR family regulator